MKYILLFDFGSTFTKAAVVSKNDKKIVFSTKVPSTVKTDASVGLTQLLDMISQVIGKEQTRQAERYASSSAAGGLRMAVCGLSRSLSISAGKNASLGAGAKIVHLTAGRLNREDVSALERCRPEILLFCGGYEGGSQEALIHNAEQLADSTLSCPIIFGGNSAVATDIYYAMRKTRKECLQVPNIIPDVGELNIEAAEESIRSLFMEKITNMKGLDKVKRYLGSIALPTPAAVLQAGELLSLGGGDYSALGSLMIVDIGGATTDIHSYAEHTCFEGSRYLGAAEPYAKRTVEGDLGMRESSDTLLDEASANLMALNAGVSETFLNEAIARRVSNPAFLPLTDEEAAVDKEIGRQATKIAARRHAGRVERIISSNCRYLQKGKNLTGLQTVLGTGGQIVNSPDPGMLLREILVKREEEPEVLLPEQSSFYVDDQYMLYAAGLLRPSHPDLALAVMHSSMKQW